MSITGNEAMKMLEVRQIRSGQYWISKPGEVTYAVGAAQAAELLGYTIDEVRRLVIAVVEINTEAIA